VRSIIAGSVAATDTHRMKMLTRLAALLGLVMAAACGGNADSGDGGVSHDDGGTPSCLMPAACGGNVVGAWRITGSCVTFTLDLASVCPGLTADGTLKIVGGATYSADLTYVQTGTAGGTFQYHFPSSCLSGMTCAQRQADLMTTGTQMGTFSSVICRSAAGGGCTCDVTLLDSPNDETGTYTTTGGVLTTVHGGVTDETNYCVTGNVMQQVPSGDANQGTVPGTLKGSISLSKP
jgi:hypothetical protein